MLDLFSGIGGFALAASWVWADRLELVGFCEIDPYCQQVLANRWPKVPIFEDIKQLSADQFQDIDLITGGFPCQDISVAGQGRGLEGERSGLWFEMLRLIGRIRPRYALIENVPMLIHRGLGRVLCDLTQVGYDAEWQVISAADVGAPHLRQRIWVVAYPTEFGSSGSGQFIDSCHQEKGGQGQAVEFIDERFGSLWSVEPSMGRVAYGVPYRVDRLKSLGNAIVPQCAALIMNQIRRNDEF
jgi:DNA (cytosine-5)-methyltransferase 1